MRILILSLAFLFFSSLGFCQEPATSAPKAAEASLAAKAGGIVTDAMPGPFGGHYEVEARTWVVKDDEGKPKAEIFHTYYRLKDSDATKRPISFVFNGGPGSSSVWLHLGGLGPRRVAMTPDGEAFAPPGQVIANDYNWLEFSDLVFIDPVGTGFSRPLEGVSGQEFYGLEEDLRWVAEFIRLFCSQEKRWASKKFLVGESYGTTRAAGLADLLQNQHDMYLNGVVLISPILNFGTARFDAGHDLAYLCFLPTYAAIAHHHGRAGQNQTLTEFVDAARKFALGDYNSALIQGDLLSEESTTTIAQQLASFTGLTEDFIRRQDLRIDQNAFRRALLDDEQRSVGRMDGRFSGPERDAGGTRPELDHSLTAITGPYASAIKDYFSRVLGYEEELSYRILTGKVHPWSYAGFQNRYVNVAERLRHAMTVNPHLQVKVCCGYYDLATPFLAMEYTSSHMGLKVLGKERMNFSYYPAGHMMYIHEKSLIKLRDDLQAFYRAATR